jgi:hypothetical protein
MLLTTEEWFKAHCSLEKEHKTIIINRVSTTLKSERPIVDIEKYNLLGWTAHYKLIKGFVCCLEAGANIKTMKPIKVDSSGLTKNGGLYHVFTGKTSLIEMDKLSKQEQGYHLVHHHELLVLVPICLDQGLH